ncbi:P-loop containing nucleoside triphosphate hydrolase protein [Lepidopterella palustris CBS 459.81]|uniref:P-loop containing nucleoside triphosphate hydrolase protein n=1 Tax=Lepidopterella palustris CBS 459.81 TaxID=1314670 RepID=A0A8E2JD01_9PEZI|nr:P-loop containing nucleoside triphosphate hydrolase protein [Lepidopterella palustris CBS 459.81]
MILETIIPGFSILRQIFLNWFRFDITSLVAKAIFAAIVASAGQSIVEGIKELLFKFCFSSVTVPVADRLNREVLTWMSVHVVEKGSRHFAAKSSKRHGKSYHYQPSDFDERTPSVRYLPTIGAQWFWHRGRPFLFRQYESTDKLRNAGGGFEIKISCLGRNPEPLKRFLEDCKIFDDKINEGLTMVHTKGHHYNADCWSEPILKSSRPLDTVDLDVETKQDLVNDITEYLHPSARRSYGRRGIPYRRGYLFYGPPGTGKTSMCLALAGHFKLELYTLSGYGVRDDALAKLFATLPPKCIVLLEDIDSAGVTREHMIDEDGEKTKNQTRNGPPEQPPGHPNAQGITLSGLLNAIDGTTSQEGRVLIMTSNTPETLEPALVRPGRIDKQVFFGPISKQSAENLFVRIFSNTGDTDTGECSPIWLADGGLDRQELKDLATLFAEKIPVGTVTPAEVQGFLINNRKPRDSVAKVESWVQSTIEARRKRALEIMEAKKSERVNGSAPPVGPDLRSLSSQFAFPSPMYLLEQT